MIDSKEKSGIKLSNSKWAKPAIKPFGFLKGTTKLIYGTFTSVLTQPTSIFHITTGFWEILESFGFKYSAEQIGWQLISKSLQKAFYSLIAESINDLKLEDNFEEKHINELDKLDQNLNTIFAKDEYYIGTDFFNSPEKLRLLDAIVPVFDKYLQIFNFDKPQRKNILRRLKNYFVFALVEEWRSNPTVYGKLADKLNTPFANAESKAYQWTLYRQSLIKVIHEPVFQETFDLSDIYIPLRAYYEKREKKKTDVNQTIIQDEKELKGLELEEYLLEWISDGNKNDCIKVISGGPGYGKSSFLKMFAAKLALDDRKVLFIPLHRFELKNELELSLLSYLNYDKYITTFNPIDEENLIIIFDGLDELGMQGDLLADVAQKFLREVQRKVDNYNHNSAKIKVIISGRDVIIQQNQSDFRKEGQILKLMPYYLDEEFKDLFKGQKKLVNVDQRQLWWKKYGVLKGKKYKGLPEELQKDDLDEITAQPLLNYLVALSYERKKIVFTNTINLNEVYNDLLEAVYERSYSSGGCIRSISSLSKNSFFRLLEEIAVSAWHGNGRKTSIRAIKEHFDNSGLNKLLDSFTKDAEKGVVSLLAAFYFRQAGQHVEGYQTFEFTHKSFGEYLMARRILAQVRLICKNIKENKENLDEGFDVKQGLKRWIKLFGPKALDEDMVKFIRNEINIIDISTLKEIQKLLCELIDYELQYGMPVEKEELGLNSYREENQYAINAEKGLFVILSLIASKTDKISDIKWQSNKDFGNLLKRLCEQRQGPYVFMLRFFNHLRLDRQILFFQDLYFANFKRSSLQRAQLMGAILSRANCSEVNFRGTNLRNTTLQGTNLEGANLRGAILYNANLYDANLHKADLHRADLREVDLRDTDLRYANLRGADLRDTNLTDVDLQYTNLEETILDNKVLLHMKKNSETENEDNEDEI